MDKLNTQKYYQTLKSLIAKHYERVKSCGEINKENTKYLDGYICAAIDLNIATSAELQGVIDEVHLEIFGMSRHERQREDALSNSGNSPWTIFEKPAWQRKKKK